MFARVGGAILKNFPIDCTLRDETLSKLFGVAASFADSKEGVEHEEREGDAKERLFS